MVQTFQIPTGATSFDIDINPVFTIPPPPVNNAPVSNAGADSTVQLPTSSITLVGLGSDPDGDALTYLWEKISGGSATIVSPTSATTNVTGLVAGNYVFRLTVTDIHSASTFDERNVTVKAEVVTPPPTGNLTFSKNYDSVSEITTNQKPSTNLALFISTTVKKDGAASFKTFTNGVNTSSGVRCEEQYNQAEANPTEGVVEYDVFYENYKQTGWGGSSIQWHPNNNNSGTLFLYTTEGKFTVVRSLNGTNFYQNGDTASPLNKTIESNKWYHMKWEYKWSKTNNGYAKLSIDGVPYYSFTGITMDADGKPYLKIGQNNWGSSVGTTVYYDNLRIYTIQP